MATEAEAIFSVGHIIAIVFISYVCAYIALKLGKREQGVHYNSTIEEMLDTHFLLKIFFLILSVIFIVVSIFTAIGYEEEFLTSATGGAFDVAGSWISYAIIFVFAGYWLLWTIFTVLIKMKPSEDDDEEY
jgi:hypothetical protein